MPLAETNTFNWPQYSKTVQLGIHSKDLDNETNKSNPKSLIKLMSK